MKFKSEENVLFKFHLHATIVEVLEYVDRTK